MPGGENLGRVTRAVASSAATALKELSPLVYQLSTGGAGKLSINTTTTSGGSGKDEREREHSPAARALKAAGGSSGDLTDNIADRNTQDAVELIKSIRSADAKTNEGASNFVSLISSINSSAKKGEKESGNGHSLAGQPIVKQSSLPASFAPPPQPQPSPKNNSVDGNSAFGDSNGKNSGTAKGNVTGVKRELESDKGGDALAGRPLKKVATIGN